jgi:hypothetical protein
MRHVLQIGNRYGRIPSSRITCEVEDLTISGMLRPDGEIELCNTIDSVKLEDGRIHRHAFFTTPEAAEKWSENRRKLGEKISDVPIARDLTIEPVSRQTLEFAFSSEIKQLVAKIALVGLAYKYGIDYALKPQFDKLRERIFLSNVPVRVFANEDFADYELRTPNQHSVITYLSAGLHHGWSLITLFGGLSYLVHLTDEFHERHSRSFSVHYDIKQKKEYSPIVLMSECDLMKRVLSEATKFESLEGLDEQWFKIVEADCKARGLTIFRTVTKPDTETQKPEALGLPAGRNDE